MTILSLRSQLANIGNVSELLTVSKEITSAINEINQDVIDTQDQINTIKTDLINAINLVTGSSLPTSTSFEDAIDIVSNLDIIDTSDATAIASEIASGKTVYIDGNKITGTSNVLLMELNNVWITTTGINLNTPRSFIVGVGSQNATVSFGGSNGSTGTSNTESFSSNVWTNRSNMNSTRYESAGAGISISALSFGGTSNGVSANCEMYNDTAWTTTSGQLNEGRRRLTGVGYVNAAMAISGYPFVADDEFAPDVESTEKYNGTTWSTDGYYMDSGIQMAASSGVTNAALVFGGGMPSNNNNITVLYPINLNREYNGTTWYTSSTRLNVSRASLAGCGNVLSTLAFGGTTNGSTLSNVTEVYNGTAWSTSGSLIVGRMQLGGSGSRANALSFGGYTNNILNNTEKFAGSI